MDEFKNIQFTSPTTVYCLPTFSRDEIIGVVQECILLHSLNTREQTYNNVLRRNYLIMSN